ncbi:paraquat-inducible protein A [Desulfopila aestuarii]|uniref:Paraquat-inducible protein A n=1 Tax=Desulfopila aestuarii DSM 18488 TaxID=1121416 RepID=A0A1M7Y428_9BACT|nr:paraquat-inducible protein A [Desulfopila aestuarii]SHO47010.1 paraquat-inducible protein A [Desulfopila aestuarii DSM 18488]
MGLTYSNDFILLNEDTLSGFGLDEIHPMHQIACHDCDLVQKLPPMPKEGAIVCLRCGSVLIRTRHNSIDRTLAWTIAGMVLYSVAVSFPFLAMKSGSIIRETALLSGVQQLFGQGEIVLATIVLLTCVTIPLLQMLLLLYIFLPLKYNFRVYSALPVFRVFQHFKPWSMMEIYMLGILVAIVKLGKMATIVPGLAVIAFALLVIVLACAISSIDDHLVWDCLEEKR